MINTMENTATRTWTILDVEFELDELRDIVNHGMSAGVSGFIYTKDCVDKFNEHDDEIEEYLSDWYMTTWVRTTTSVRLHLMVRSPLAQLMS